MNEAFEKNEAAIRSITGCESLSTLTKSCKIGVWSGDNPLKSGELIAKSLGEYLGRFWHNIDASGCYSKIVTDSAKLSASSCKFNSTIQQQWNPPYDFVIGIGTSIPQNDTGISIGADGWKVNSGQKTFLSDDPNPVGPFFASALASTQVFKSIFKEKLPGEILLLPQDYEWSSWYGNVENDLNSLDLEFDEIHVFGIGAVSHGFFWVLQNWPGKIYGKIHLIDPDCYDHGNPQRYLGTTPDDIGKPKTDRMMQKLQQSHPELDVTSHKLDMNNYFTKENQQCFVRLALCGLDSYDGRRQLALKLPKKVINMWTSEYHVGASKFSFENNWPCLYCEYPESKEKIPDETGMIHNELGLCPPRIRDLLYTGTGINISDAKIIGRKLNLDPESILGKPIRSVRGEVCATGKIILPSNTTEATVPLPFASGIAGAIGFIETLREIKNIRIESGQLQIAILKYPTVHSWYPRTKNPDCYLCSDNSIQQILEKKYPITANT